MPSFRLNSQCVLAALLSIAISGCSSSGSGNSSEAPAGDNTSPAPISTPGETETETGTESEPETESETPADPQTPEVEQPTPPPGAGEPVIPTTEASFSEVDQPDWSILMKEGTWLERYRTDLLGTPERVHSDKPEYLGARFNFERLSLFTVETVSDNQVLTYNCGTFNKPTRSVLEIGNRFSEILISEDTTDGAVALCETTISNRYFAAPDALRVERYCHDEKMATIEFVRVSNSTQFEVAKVALDSASIGSIRETSGVCGDRLTNYSKIDSDYLDVVEEKYRDFGGYAHNWSVSIPYGDDFLKVLVIASGDLTSQDLAVGQTWPLATPNPNGPTVLLHISQVWPEDSSDDLSNKLALRAVSGTLEIIALEDYLTTFQFEFISFTGEEVNGSFTIDFGQQ